MISYHIQTKLQLQRVELGAFLLYLIATESGLCPGFAQSELQKMSSHAILPVP